MESVSISISPLKLIDMKKTLFFIFTLAVFASCNNSSLTSKDKSTTKNGKEIETTKDVMLPPASNKSSATNELISSTEKLDSTGTSSNFIPQGSTPNTTPDWDKKIIKTASLKLQVKDFKTFADVVHKAAKQYGGYVADEEQNQSEEKIESTISIKVPVEQFESLINQLPSGAEKMIEKKITSEDVTGEVVDTKSRLQAKEVMRLKYLEFLKQSKNMEDVLKVQDEINNIQEEMETASGRINYLSHQSAFSTINLTFYQPLAGFDPNDNPGFFTRSIIAFKSGFHFIAKIFISLISIWPILLIAIIVWGFFRRRSLAVISARQKM